MRLCISLFWKTDAEEVEKQMTVDLHFDLTPETEQDDMYDLTCALHGWKAVHILWQIRSKLRAWRKYGGMPESADGVEREILDMIQDYPDIEALIDA